MKYGETLEIDILRNVNKCCAGSRDLRVALFLRFSNIFSVKIKLIKIKKNFLGMQPNFESRENRLVFRPFPNRNGHLVGLKRGFEISSKKAAISYFNLFCKPYNETTTESSKTLNTWTGNVSNSRYILSDTEQIFEKHFLLRLIINSLWV